VSKGRIIAAVVALVVIAAIVAGVFISAQSSVPTVSTATVSKETLSVLVTASGKMEAGQKADVFPPTAGTLASVVATDGQQVKAGQLIATMDSGPLELAVDQARAGVKAAQSQLDLVSKGVPTSADLAAANANIDAACAAYSAAKNAYDAFNQAFKLAGGPASMEATLTQLNIAKKQAFAGLETAESGKSKLSVAGRVGAQRAAANAGITQANTALMLAEDNLSKVSIVSPIDGVVLFNATGTPDADGSLPKAMAGTAVSPVAAPFTVVQLGSLNFDAQVDEADVDRVRAGMKATVRLDAFPSQSFGTTVTNIKPAAIQTTTGGVAFPVLLNLSSTGKSLLIGMSGSADIQVSAVADSTTVPIEALTDENGKSFVYIVAAGKLKKTEVKTGALTDTRAEIVSGVSVGDVVVVGGLTGLKDGQAVRTK
jgi:RND family efflux transporter MFP subunit